MSDADAKMTDEESMAFARLVAAAFHEISERCVPGGCSVEKEEIFSALLLGGLMRYYRVARSSTKERFLEWVSEAWDHQLFVDKGN